MTARLNPATTLRKKLEKPLENPTTINLIESLSTKTFKYHIFCTSSTKVVLSIKLWRTSTDNTKLKVAESEIIGANHLGFTKSLFQHYCQYLGLNHNHIFTKSAFNFYVNEKISSLLGTPVNTELAKETFYKELIQNTNLPTNHNFASIITEINKEIEHHTQQKYPITYANKDKGKLQTPAVTSRKIQPPAWKKNRVEFPSNPSYHYTPGKLLGPYGEYFKRFNSRSSTPSRLQSPPPPPDFGISDLWEAAESEKEEEESEDQEFTYQHPITENPELSPQQPGQQQLLQQPPQLPNLDPMAYAPIAKLDNFTGEENDTQIWLNDVEKAIAANRWNNSLINKPQDFNVFKAEFLKYFSNNNSINCLVNAFTTIKQRETEAVTTYLGRFYQNLHQIQAIDANYFTALQILNQFIHGLCSSILQHVRPLHPGTLQDAVTHIRDFESTESEANHAQAVNLVMNRLSELDSKLEKFTAATSNISTTATNHLSTPTNSNTNPEPSSNDIRQPLIQRSCTQNLDTSYIQNPNSQHYLSLLVTPEDTTSNNTEFNQHVPTNTIPPAIISSNESLAAIFPFELEENTPIPLFSGATLEEKPITAMYMDARVDGHLIKLILDSGSAGSIITRQLMDQLGCRVDQAASTRIIIANGTTKTPISEIDDFPIEINGIIIPIKVLVMDATQYQALVDNDWLSKTNAMLDWTTQELILSQNRRHTRVPAMCGHFKTTSPTAPLINFDEKKPKPTWEAYQVLWADKEHNKLLPILSWDNNNKGKGKQKEELTWETNDLTWTDNNKSKPTSS
ncbi:hypothetical protein G9A89_020487 [Geosiphon pyriformis]|nr:hypothetical protein G9A89_020487 [Geosiphon pyriformis]